MALIEISLFILVAIFIIYKWATFTYKTFEERGVPFEHPWPLVGNSLGIVLGKESFTKGILNFYRRNKIHKIAGYFNFRSPIYVVNDPELIKKITVKDFEYFPNHMPFFITENDKLLDGMLTNMKDQRWKDMRNTLTPIFTASKMRAMFSIMTECFDESLKNFHTKTNVGNGFDIELKDCFTRLSNDLIASTAFGLKVNSYADRNNEFYSIGQSIKNFKGAAIIKFMMSNAAPWLMKILNIQIFDKQTTDYFMRLVVDAMKYREENKSVRPDMIQLLLEAKKESTQNWSDEELVAQCFIFFFAAFENNASLICNTCHELMENPDVQQRLFEEAVGIREELAGSPLNYDAVGKMKYMDMVISESLRKWTIAVVTDRLCSKDYKLTDGDDNLVFNFKAGDMLWFPVIGLHRDEAYFENPEIFDPDRFSEENKDNIKPFTYLPFGAGPRNCIGNRYALIQAKAMIYNLILDFKLERSAKSCKNLLDESRGLKFSPVNGYWLRLVARKLNILMA